MGVAQKFRSGDPENGTMPRNTTTVVEILKVKGNNTITTPPINELHGDHDYPYIPKSGGLVELSTVVIFVYFIILPLVVCLLYLLWRGCQACFIFCDRAGGDVPFVAEEEEVEDGLDESNMIYRTNRTVPILTRLPQDYDFPTYTELEAADVHSDVFGSSYGSLISLPSFFRLCAICTCSCGGRRKKRRSNLYSTPSETFDNKTKLGSLFRLGSARSEKRSGQKKNMGSRFSIFR